MSSILNSTHKRKSAAITIVIMSLLLVGFFFIGLKYLDPPEEYGIAVNFGTSNFGKGEIQPTEPFNSNSEDVVTNEEIVEEQEEIIKQAENIKEAVAKPEEVITQESEEAIAIKKKQKKAKRKADEEARIEKERLDAIAKKKADEEAKKKKLDALIGGINNSEEVATSGQGNDNAKGDKGKITGDPNANGYYGNGGAGGGGDYNLGNRKPLNKPKPAYICNEEGLVVVRVEVNVSGKVIKATPGVKGSTNTAECLMSQAKEAALKTKWQSDTNAPSKQVGTIKYRFSLSQ